MRLLIYPVLIFFLVLSVYLWSMSGTVVLEDDGYFILASYFGGYAHPPGYPLYSLLGHIATMIPLGSVASRMHGLSAVIGALACVCLWFFVRQLLQSANSKNISDKEVLFGDDNAGLLAALCFGFSALFWSQAIIAEVYTLNVLLFLLLCCLVLELNKAGQNNFLLRLCGLTAGLSLSNHWPLFVLSSPLLFVFLWPDRKKFLRYFLIASPFIVLGLLPYAWMVYRSHVIPELNFGGPFSTFTDFWRFVSREDFANVDTSPSAGWNDKAGFMLFALQETCKQFSVPLASLIVLGFIHQWRRLPLHISVGLLLGFLGNTLFLIVLLNFDYDLFHQNTFRVYPVIAYAICAVWLTLGVSFLYEWIVSYRSHKYSLIRLPSGVIVLLVGIVFSTNAPINYRANDTWAEEYAKAMLIGLDKHAVLFANADTINGPVGYLNLVKGFRKDVTLYSGFSANISNKLYRLYQYRGDELRALVNTFVKEQQNSIYYTNDFPHDCGIESYGLFFKVDKADCGNASNPSFVVKIAPRIINYYTKIASNPEPYDPWEKMHNRLLKKDFCQLLINSTDLPDLLTELEGNNQSVTYHSVYEIPFYKIACDNYLGVTSIIKALLLQASPNWELINSLFELGEIYRDREAITKQDAAQLDLLKGDMWLVRHDHEQSRQSYLKALALWPHPYNLAHEGLQKLQRNKSL